MNITVRHLGGLYGNHTNVTFEEGNSTIKMETLDKDETVVLAIKLIEAAANMLPSEMKEQYDKLSDFVEEMIEVSA